MQNVTVEKIENNTSSVAIINANGSGSVQSIQNIVNQLAQATAQVNTLTNVVAQITALGFTLPAVSTPKQPIA